MASKRKPLNDGWALSGPDGIEPVTFNVTQDGCWSLSYDFLNQKLGWGHRYWKKIGPAKSAARRAGYAMVPIKLIVAKVFCARHRSK